jgi:hypothetical protein
MAYSGGNFATKVGSNCRNIVIASRRAWFTAARSAAGRIGSSMATDSSSARARVAASRNARARFRGFSCAVARYAPTNTLIRTSSADGAGSTSARPNTRSCTAPHLATDPEVYALGPRDARHVRHQMIMFSVAVSTRHGGANHQFFNHAVFAPRRGEAA